MIDKILTNLVYLFYPQNICAYTQKEEYFVTEEYNRLKEIIVDCKWHGVNETVINKLNSPGKAYTWGVFIVYFLLLMLPHIFSHTL
jgi:orotidine-5'-phosphate decarboxylase